MLKSFGIGFLGLLILGSIASAAGNFKTLHVADLASMIKKAPPGLTLYDVNVESTRSNVGVIPGSKLLSSSSKYNVGTELPADHNSPLVFYCANQQCTASHEAAKRAMAAGFTDVSVMVDGVFGWKKAGHPLKKILAPPEAMEPQSVLDLQKTNDAVVVDVREQEERFEIVPHSQWIPMSKVGDATAWKQFVASIPKDKTVIFYCASGYRSKNAAQKLFGDGFKAAYFKSADQWKNAGLPVEKGPAR